MHQDHRYITALLTNDRLVITEIYEKFAGKIRWMILQNNGADADAADIFQESLTAIYQKAVKGDFVLTCPFESFLFIICKNKWLNELQKRKTSNVTFIDTDGYTVGEDSIRLAELVLQKEKRRNLLELKLSELGEGCKKILELSWGGKAMDEVALLLNMTYGYVRKKKSECMAKLVELVKNAPQFMELKW